VVPWKTIVEDLGDDDIALGPHFRGKNLMMVFNRSRSQVCTSKCGPIVRCRVLSPRSSRVKVYCIVCPYQLISYRVIIMFSDFNLVSSWKLRDGRRSLIWKYFHYEAEVNGGVALCMTCSKPMKFVRGVSKTSNLIQHLRQHVKPYGEYVKFTKQWRTNVISQVLHPEYLQ